MVGIVVVALDLRQQRGLVVYHSTLAGFTIHELGVAACAEGFVFTCNAAEADCHDGAVAMPVLHHRELGYRDRARRLGLLCSRCSFRFEHRKGM
jgi:hypothetical protein